MASRKSSLRLRGALVLCALSGALLALAFPRPGWWPLAWVALVPWLIALRLGTGAGALLGSWLGGFVFFGVFLYWLGLFGVSVWFLACVLLGIALLVWGAGVRWMGKLSAPARIVGAAALWCGIEWVRGLGRFGFTWGWLGYSQSPAFRKYLIVGKFTLQSFADTLVIRMAGNFDFYILLSLKVAD